MNVFLTLSLLPGLLADITILDDTDHCKELRRCRLHLKIQKPADYSGIPGVLDILELCEKLPQFLACSDKHYKHCYTESFITENEIEKAQMEYKCTHPGRRKYLTMTESNTCHDVSETRDMVNKFSDCHGTLGYRIASLKQRGQLTKTNLCRHLFSFIQCVYGVAGTCYKDATDWIAQLYVIQVSIRYKHFHCPYLEKTACSVVPGCFRFWKMPAKLYYPRDFAITWFVTSFNEIGDQCLIYLKALSDCVTRARYQCHDATALHFYLQTRVDFLERLCSDRGKSTIKPGFDEPYYFLEGRLNMTRHCWDPLNYRKFSPSPRHPEYDPLVCVLMKQQQECMRQQAAARDGEKGLGFHWLVEPYTIQENLQQYRKECDERDTCSGLLGCERKIITRNYSKECLDYDLSLHSVSELIHLCSNFSKLQDCWRKHSESCHGRETRQKVWNTMKWIQSLCYLKSGEHAEKQGKRPANCTVIEGRPTTLTCSFPEKPCTLTNSTMFWFVSDRFKMAASCNATSCSSGEYSEHFTASISKSSRTHFTSRLQIHKTSLHEPFDMTAAWNCFYCDGSSLQKTPACRKLNVKGACKEIDKCRESVIQGAPHPGFLSTQLVRYGEDTMRRLCNSRWSLIDCMREHWDTCVNRDFLRNIRTDIRLLSYFCTGNGFKLFSDMRKSECIECTSKVHQNLRDSFANQLYFVTFKRSLQPYLPGCMCFTNEWEIYKKNA